jgi:type IV secretion system protein VirB6
MSFQMFNTVQAAVLAPVLEAVDVSGTLVTWVLPFFVLGITLKLTVYGLNMIRGSFSGSPILDALAECAKPFLVLNLGLIGGRYASNVVASFMELRNDLAGLYGPKASNSYAALDNSVSLVMDAIVKLIPDALQNITLVPTDLTGVLSLTALGAIGLATLFYAVVAALNLLMIDAALAVILGVGPLFIACLAFQATAKFFDSWLSAVFKYTLTAVFMSMVIGVTSRLVQKLATNFSANPDTGEIIYLAVGFVCTAALMVDLLLKAATIAADLAGGIGVNITGPSSVANTMKRAAAPAVNAAGYAAGAAIGGGGRAMQAAARTPLGVSVLQSTLAMRENASAAATGARNIAAAVGGGHGAGHAFNVGRAAAGSGSGHGMVTGSRRPIPHARDIGY